MKLKTALFALILILLASTNPLAAQTSSTRIQLVRTRGNTGNHAQIEIDSTGRIHIVYFAYIPDRNQTSYRLRYVIWDGLAWRQQGNLAAVERIPDDTHVGFSLDENDRPHVIYGSTQDNDDVLTYVTIDEEGIVYSAEIGELALIRSQAALALDSNGRPHVTYNSSSGLAYTHFDGTNWQTESVYPSSLDEPPSIAISAAGTPYVAFRDLSGAVWVAERGAADWTRTAVVDGNRERRGQPRLVISPAGMMHLVFAFEDEAGEELRYATKSLAATTWTIETLVTVATQPQIGLVVDSAENIHVSYASDLFAVPPQLYYLTNSAGTPQSTLIDGEDSAGAFHDIALDQAEGVHFAYYAARFGDLRYATFGALWESADVGIPGTLSAPKLDFDRTPSFLFHNQASGELQTAIWEASSWLTNTVDALPAPVDSAYLDDFRDAATFYQPNTQDLYYVENPLNPSLVRILDTQGDVGRSNSVAIANNMAHIVYWDATNNQIKLARFSLSAPDSPIAFSVNTAAPPLDANSGQPRAVALSNGQIGVVYFDATNLALRFAIYNPAADSWQDEPLQYDIVTPRFDVAFDSGAGVPVVAFYSPGFGLVMMQRTADGWAAESVPLDVGGLDSLDLELGLNSAEHARIALGTTGSTVLLAVKRTYWQIEFVAEGYRPNAGGLSLALADRPYIAYPHANGGISLAHRRTTLDVSLANTVIQVSEPYNPLDACRAAVFELFFGDDRSRNGGLIPDGHVFPQLHALFAQTAAGQEYIDLYIQHGSEMAQIGLSDAQLLRDSFGTLQNFMPGLEALVGGNGEQLLITQQQVDDALNVWQRLAAAGSPTLANVINSQLAQNNDLQDFVGLSYAEWATAIGVEVDPSAVGLVSADVAAAPAIFVWLFVVAMLTGLLLIGHNANLNINPSYLTVFEKRRRSHKFAMLEVTKPIRKEQ